MCTTYGVLVFAGAFRPPPTTMNLLSGLDAPAVEVEPNTADTAADELPLIKAPADQQSDESARYKQSLVHSAS